MAGDCRRHGYRCIRGLVGEPDLKKPKFTVDDKKYAIKTSRRLLHLYGAGMNSRQIATEMCVTPSTASKAMRRHGFYAFDPIRDRRYATDEVAAVMTLRHHIRMAELKRVEP